MIHATSSFGQTSLALKMGTSLVKDLALGPLLEKVFDKLLKDKTPKEAARPKLRELYVSLLEVQDRRELLLQAIQERIKVQTLPSPGWERSDRLKRSDEEANKLSRDNVARSATDAKAAFIRLKKAFSELNVDLDSSDPELSDAMEGFIAAQQPIYVTRTIDVDNIRALNVAAVNIEKNRFKLQSARDQLRALTQKLYPTFGELL
jgi:hypothetical protein